MPLPRSASKCKNVYNGENNTIGRFRRRAIGWVGLTHNWLVIAKPVALYNGTRLSADNARRSMLSAASKIQMAGGKSEMNTTWLLAAVVIVMVSGLIGTLMIGLSKSNKEENPDYFRHTGRKCIRLSGIYVVGIVVVVIIFIALLNR